MSLDLLLAESFRRWKEDRAPIELKRYARREWGAETCFLHLHSRSKHLSSGHSVAVALSRMVQSLLGITRSRPVNEDRPPANNVSVSKPVHSTEVPSSSIASEDVSTGPADPLIIGLGDKKSRTDAESAPTAIPHTSEI